MSSQTMAKRLVGSLQRISNAKTEESAARVIDRECRSLGTTPEELYDVTGYLIEQQRLGAGPLPGQSRREHREAMLGQVERRGFTGTWSLSRASLSVEKTLTVAEARRLMNQ